MLREKGFERLRVDEIAEVAGVSNATLYRRWPSKLELASDAFAILPELPEPASGTLIGDLVELVTSTVELFREGPLSGALACRPSPPSGRGIRRSRGCSRR